MRVKANFPNSNKFGWYANNRQYHGDEFELETEKHFSEKWMIDISPKPEEPKKEEVTEVKPSVAAPKKRAKKVETETEDLKPFV